MKRYLRPLALTATHLGLLLLTSCESDEQNTIAKAQACLNSATAATANQCRDMVAVLNTPASYIIRCSADFLTKGLTASNMAESFINRDKTTTSQDPLLGFMGILAFESDDLANTAYQDCNQTGVQSFVLFGSMSRMATKIGSFSTALDTIRSGQNPTQAEMEAAIDTIDSLDPNDPDDAETLEVLGETAVQVNSSYCTGENVTNDVCRNIREAIGSNTSSAAIGAALVDALKAK